MISDKDLPNVPISWINDSIDVINGKYYRCKLFYDQFADKFTITLTKSFWLFFNSEHYTEFDTLKEAVDYLDYVWQGKPIDFRTDEHHITYELIFDAKMSR